jgi:hypothetical protein
MKKVLLSAAALMIGAVSFAQVAGAPTSQVVSALPGAAATANAGESIQNGNANKVQVRQAGTNQSVYTNQNDGSTGLGGNLARVFQTGDVSAPSGIENAAEVLQSGAANQSTTIQQGDYNNAYTAQGQNDDASSGNKARIQQGTGDQAEENYAAIEQDGTDNQAQTLQTYDNSDAWTRQLGTENKSMITQNAAPDGSDGHSARNYQDGNRNESFMSQSGAGGRNDALAQQVGDDNQVKQTQTTNAVAGSGMGNRALVSQGTPGALVNPGTIGTEQVLIVGLVQETFPGIPFISAGDQPSVGARAKQVQNGKLQEAEIFQYGGSLSGSNYGEQVQASGWNNDAALFQISDGTADNYAKQYQAGDNNYVGLVQENDGHKALQDQRGHRNSAISTQQDGYNLLNIHQRGNDNYAESDQAGFANSALIVQYGGQSYVASQNLNGLGGGGNQIDALQLGPNGDFGSAAIDCGFEDPMNLDMDYTVPGFDLGDVCPDC